VGGTRGQPVNLGMRESLEFERGMHEENYLGSGLKQVGNSQGNTQCNTQCTTDSHADSHGNNQGNNSNLAYSESARTDSSSILPEVFPAVPSASNDANINSNTNSANPNGPGSDTNSTSHAARGFHHDSQSCNTSGIMDGIEFADPGVGLSPRRLGEGEENGGMLLD
jgi:hypothetical protein